MNSILFIIHCVGISISLLGATAYRKELLISLVCLMGILSNLFVIKQINLFGFAATAADMYAVGAALGLNLLQEYWGKNTAKKTIWANFLCSLFYLSMVQFHLAYIPNAFDASAKSFVEILFYTPRLVCASFISYLISQYVECSLFEFLKNSCDKRWFLLRNYGSLIFSQFLDTLLFSFIGLYGIVGNITHVIFISYLIKIGALIFSVPFIALTKLVVPPKEEL